MKKKTKIAWIVTSFLLFLVICFGYQAVPEAYSADSPDTYYFHEGWTQIIGDSQIELDDIQDFQQLDAGTPLIFTCTLPEIADGEALLLYSSNQEVTAYVDDICIHDFSMQEGLEFLKTPGSAWNQIDLTADMSNKTLRLEIRSDIDYYTTNYLSSICLVNSSRVESARFQQIWFLIALAITLGLLTLSAFINARIWVNSHRKHYFLSLSGFYLTILLWWLTHLHVYELITHRPLVSYLLEMFFIRCIPMGLHLFLRSNYSGFPRATRVIGWISLHNIFIAIILQFTVKLCLLESLWINDLIFLLNLGLYACVLFKRLRDSKRISTHDIPYLLIGVLLLGVICDVSRFTFFSLWMFPPGMFTLISCTLYTSISLIVMRHQDAMLAQEKDTLESSYQRLQTTSLMQQIKAHFIFNTLNTISSLCKRDAKAADKAVTLFATYMRDYMYLINTMETIPLEKELSLVTSYLNIEKIRFGDKFEFVINADYKNFKLPPLSLQPIIENAVVHGIHGLKSGGYISLTTMRVENIAEIIIQDNGVGFDTDILNTEQGVALSNLKKRIEMMTSGAVAIRSEKGQGTTVIIYIPLPE